MQQAPYTQTCPQTLFFVGERFQSLLLQQASFSTDTCPKTTKMQGAVVGNVISLEECLLDLSRNVNLAEARLHRLSDR